MGRQATVGTVGCRFTQKHPPQRCRPDHLKNLLTDSLFDETVFVVVIGIRSLLLSGNYVALSGTFVTTEQQLASFKD